ncbi:ABC1 kinase family protein [Chondromyces apiculatus]|uniref:ABC1 kinase family protein n=1 Tax=Chondromyces apiculatus TaxID=51 RepID=UPI001E5D40DB|nr:AarF/UbiB family protein [Chondromyces apiculatus]
MRLRTGTVDIPTDLPLSTATPPVSVVPMPASAPGSTGTPASGPPSQRASRPSVRPPSASLVPLMTAEPAEPEALVRRKPAPVSVREKAAQSGRFVRAYATTFAVLGSYLWFSFLGRLFGRPWSEARIGEVHRRNARRIERTIMQLQGLFIKVGQLLSIMANFLPVELREGLTGLQDQVPPRPYAEIAVRVEAELGKPIPELFARFTERPIASASLGQVHEAWLKDGTHVAVKVQHRDIDEIVRLDLATIRRIMAIVSMFVPVRGLDAYYHQVRAMISEELDFAMEAANIVRISENFAGQDDVRFPAPIPGYCTRRVMTTAFVEGVKVGDLAALEALGVDRKDLARRIVKAFCQMIFVDGIYHADPHPGNMLVARDGALILLDFGAVAELSPQTREGIPEFLEAVIRRDTDRIVKAMRKMGFLARGDNLDVSEKVVEFFHQRFQEEVRLDKFNLKDIKIDPQRGIESLIDLKRMNIGLKELSGAFHIPRDWVLLERTLLLLTGLCTQLDPELNPIEVVRPYLQEFVLGNRDWAQIALEAAKDMGLKALTLPDDLRKYLTRANRGEAEMRIRGLSQAAGLIYAGVRQLIFAALGIAAGMAALQLHLAGQAALAQMCLYGAGGALALLVLSLLFTRRA